METQTTRFQNSLRIFSRRIFPTIMLICLLGLTAAPAGAQPQQSIPSRYTLSFVAQPSSGTVTIQQSVDLTARRQITSIRQADQSVHQFDFSYNEQGATLQVFLQRQPVLSVNFPASPTADPQITWLNGTTPDSLHQALFQDVQLLSQMRADRLSRVGIPIEAAYQAALETSDAVYGSAPNRFIRTTIYADSTLLVDPLVTFCSGYADDIYERCEATKPPVGAPCWSIRNYAYAQCILILS
jgi:hypothetical protein